MPNGIPDRIEIATKFDAGDQVTVAGADGKPIAGVVTCHVISIGPLGYDHKYAVTTCVKEYTRVESQTVFVNEASVRPADGSSRSPCVIAIGITRRPATFDVTQATPA